MSNDPTPAAVSDDDLAAFIGEACNSHDQLAAQLAEVEAQRRDWLDNNLTARMLVALEKELAQVTAERERLVEVLALDEPWPLRDVLNQLRAATSHLLDAHSCDAHGHESFKAAMRQAETLIVRIDAALAKHGGAA